MTHPPGHRVDVFLQPGECFAGDEHYTLRTLLGSCVSITLWHPRHRIGAMSHFLLPTRNMARRGSPDGRYGDEAMLLMRDELARFGLRPAECRAKVFGGASMFPEQAQPGAACVGKKNGEAARELLRAHGIEPVSEHLFGVGHRQIIFNVHTGDVWAHQAHLADFAGQGKE